MNISATITEKDGKVRLTLEHVCFGEDDGRMFLNRICKGNYYDFPDQKDVFPFIEKFEKMQGVKVVVKEL